MSIQELVREELDFPRNMSSELVQFELACESLKGQEALGEELNPLIGTGRRILGEINFMLSHSDYPDGTELVLKKLRIHLAKNLSTLTNTKFE